MNVRIKEFENRIIDEVSELRNELGATCVELSIRVDNYEKNCRTNVTFLTSKPGDASAVPGGVGACKVD